MSDDTVIEATSARNGYESRPWLKHYPSFIQPDITPRFTNGLEMFLTTTQTMPDQIAMYYFDRTISYGELDRTSNALAFALKQRGVK
jgi:long-chain acyl-CoA synthetase